jgi:hypothetical protein
MRKTITYDSNYKGFTTQVFDPPGAYISILERALKLIYYALEDHSQVLVNGFCAKYPIDDDPTTYRDYSNKTFLNFLESTRINLLKHDFDPLIIWCREQTQVWDRFGCPHNPHWHFTILSDGNKHLSLHTYHMNKLWNMHLGRPFDARGLIHRSKLGGDYFGYMMRRNNPESIATAYKAISYLSKCTSKEFTPPGSDMYDSSQLPNKNKQKKVNII